MPSRSLGLALLLATAGCGSGPTAPTVDLTSGQCQPAYQSVADSARVAVQRAAGWSAGVLVEVAGVRQCELYFGDDGPTSTVLLASAAKWLSAATIMAVVDHGLMSLDDSVGKYLPGMAQPAASITLAQLLSHTSGVSPNESCVLDPSVTMEACARTILAATPIAPPGLGFYYGGSGFTVAGAMVEAATGKPWAQVFQEFLATPAELTHTDYGPGTNPALSEGGVESSLTDYGRFLAMLLADGTIGSTHVLSPAAVAELRRTRTDGVQILFSPRGSVAYTLGSWADQAAGGVATISSSPGSRGFIPYLDWERRIVVVVMAFDSVDRVWPLFTTVWNETGRQAGQAATGPPQESARALP
jgi:CubicO group peptidase (beta-lactamase class C family)